MRTDVLNPAMLQGFARLYRVPFGCLHRAYWRPVTAVKANTILYDWSRIVARLLTQGLSNYRIGAINIEYENVADPDDPVTIPTFDRSGGIAYYDGLSVSAVRDYIRAPLIAGVFEDGDDANLSDNVLRFFAQTSGVVGVHGKAFSEAANSKVFGIGLVSMPDEDDATQDIVMGRLYFDADDQVVKLDSSNVGVEYILKLQ